MTAFACEICKADLGVRRLAGACPKCGARFAPAGAWRWVQHLPLVIVIVGILLVSPLIQRFTNRPFGVSEYTILFVGVAGVSVVISTYVLRNARLQWTPR
ncbi:MAG TPA: hypothetical protein VGO52_17360 [Hyphomonadaceae bacterium]|jgi:hypothetical protein|nr:hypothetical protein [Hyphomonadaceae bacterium]